ncbi:hypothetical protein BCR43DRAFT_501713 [Syncephalastrum racemosum]|uniref:Uncharacterized protein n=1 Tax=Syncephalastrum racemosum TaxID=13706 RepID=A0A1X2HWJ9_SYNRA|nr:hypothetical protein BCR43DRAFT_501713 [Syncephalastrum racemosum]
MHGKKPVRGHRDRSGAGVKLAKKKVRVFTLFPLLTADYFSPMTATKRCFTSEPSEARLCKGHKISHESDNTASDAPSEPAQAASPPKLAGNKRTSSQKTQENEENKENAKRQKPNIANTESNDETPLRGETPLLSDGISCTECFKPCAEKTGLFTCELLATLDEVTQINEQSEETRQKEEEKEERGENGKDTVEDSGSNEVSSRELSEDYVSDEASRPRDDSEDDDESISTSESEAWSSDIEREIEAHSHGSDTSRDDLLVLSDSNPDPEDEMLSCPICNATDLVRKVGVKCAPRPPTPDHSYENSPYHHVQ